MVDRLSTAMRASIVEAQKAKPDQKALSDHLVEAANLRTELSETAGNDLGFKRSRIGLAARLRRWLGVSLASIRSRSTG